MKTGILFSRFNLNLEDIIFSKKNKFLSNTKIIIIFVIRYRFIYKKRYKYAPEYAEAIFKILLLNNSEKFVISSNILYKLSDFVENCLNYLGISFEIVAEKHDEFC